MDIKVIMDLVVCFSTFRLLYHYRHPLFSLDVAADYVASPASVSVDLHLAE